MIRQTWPQIQGAQSDPLAPFDFGSGWGGKTTNGANQSPPPIILFAKMAAQEWTESQIKLK